jgi:hypothetical protein
MPINQVSQFAVDDPRDLRAGKSLFQYVQQRQRLNHIPECTRFDEADSLWLKLAEIRSVEPPEHPFSRVNGLMERSAAILVRFNKTPQEE